MGALWLQNSLSAQNRIIRSNLYNTVKYVMNTIRRIIRLRRMTHPWFWPTLYIHIYRLSQSQKLPKPKGSNTMAGTSTVLASLKIRKGATQ